MSSPGKYPTALALLALGALSTGRAAAQRGPFLDTVDVNVVNVEVVVTDRDGVPVRGLQAGDFTILEDGKPVELSNFFAVTDGRVLPAGETEDEVAPLPTPATRRLRLVVIVDELNIRPENRNRLLGRLRSYLEQRQQAADLMMLVRTGDDLVVEQPFTQDTGLLLAALDRMGHRMNRQVEYALEYRSLVRRIQGARLPSPATTAPLSLQAAIFEAESLANEIQLIAGRRRRNVVDTINRLEHFTRTLAGLPGRKGILYVSDGLPTRTAEFLIETWRGKFETWLAASGDSRITSRLLMLNPLEFDTSAVLRRLIVEANANQVAFYPISNNSRQPPPSLSAEHQGEESGRGQGPGALMATETRSLGADESLLELAEGTGGVALINSNDIGGLLDRLRVDFDSFYSLGYLAPEGEDRGYHRIEVKLANPELVARHLNGYRRRDPFLHLQDLTLSALRFGLERNPLEVRLEPGEQTQVDKDRYDVLVTVEIPFRKLLLIPEHDRHIAELTLVAVAGDKAGGISRPRRIDLPIRIPNEDILTTADGLAVYPLRLEMKPGPQRISVGVRDLLAQVESTLSVELDVGRRASLGMSPEILLRGGSHGGPESVAASSTGAGALPGRFLDTVEVHVVNVEAVVTDRDGMPVSGLEAHDFTILEDGEPVELSNFFAVAGGEVLPAGDTEDQAAPLPTPETRRLRLVVIVDELNIRPENRNRLLGRLRSYLEQREQAADLMMLVRTGDDVVVEQPFTRDTGLLLAALDRMEGRIGRQVEYALEYRSLVRRIQGSRLPSPATTAPLSLQAAIFEAESLANEVQLIAGRRRRNVVDTINRLEHFTRTLAGLPGRKGILYVSDGLPTRTAEFLIETWRGKFETWLAACGDSRITSRLLMLNPLEFDTSAVLRRLIVEANANQVAFYPISNNSRQPPPSLSAEHQGEESGRGQGPGALMATETRSLGADESLLQLAEGTGGVALINSNDIGGLLDRLRVDFDSFYSLGYLAPADEDRGYHRIEVRLADPDLVVRHLKGYRLRDPILHLQDLALSALRFGLERNPLEVRLEPGEQTLADKDRYNVLVKVEIPFRKLLLIPQRDRHVAELTLVVVAGDDAGGFSEPRRVNLPIRVPNEDILDTADGAAVYPLRLEMKAGPQRISVGVRDLLAQVDSTLSLEIQVGAAATAPTPPEISLRSRSQRGPGPFAVAGPR